MLTVGAEGLPVDIGLTEETRRNLEKLVKQQSSIERAGEELPVADTPKENSCTEEPSISPEDLEERTPGASPPDMDSPESLPPPAPTPATSTVYITLSADSEFFHTLTAELNALEILQSRTVATIESAIIKLGNSVTPLTLPAKFSRHSDLYPWREVFQLYVESNIFISNLEAEMHAEQSVDVARKRLQRFCAQVESLGLDRKFKSKRSLKLLQQFEELNEEVLRVMRFQAINREAMRKILKSELFPPLQSDCHKLTLVDRIR